MIFYGSSFVSLVFQSGSEQFSMHHDSMKNNTDEFVNFVSSHRISGVWANSFLSSTTTTTKTIIYVIM